VVFTYSRQRQNIEITRGNLIGYETFMREKYLGTRLYYGVGVHVRGPYILVVYEINSFYPCTKTYSRICDPSASYNQPFMPLCDPASMSLLELTKNLVAIIECSTFITYSSGFNV
jgi:hypothetical protein